jgi:hypothetical protein
MREEPDPAPEERSDGEAGVGKTRLLDEFAASLAEEGRAFHFVFGTCAPDGTGRPLHAFTEAPLAALDPRDAARAELEQARIVLADAGPLSVSSRAEGLYFAALAARALGDEDACRSHMQAAWRTIRAIADRLPPSEREAFLTGSSPNREITAAVGGATG